MIVRGVALEESLIEYQIIPIYGKFFINNPTHHPGGIGLHDALSPVAPSRSPAQSCVPPPHRA